MKKAYQKIFSVGLSPLLFCAFFAIQAGEVAAQECTSDSECAEGEFCELDPLIEYCEDPEPGTEWACENIEDATGFCEDATGRCQDDSDCDENFTCRKSAMGMSMAGCAPGEDCVDVDRKPVELTPTYGRCRAEPIPCEDDSDCPSPLYCESQDTGECWESSDGESGCTKESVKTCAYQPVECESDDDCESGYECLEAGTEEDCSSEGEDLPMDDSEEVPVPDDPGSGEQCVGEDCPVPVEPEPITRPDIECVTRTVNICFPVRVDCQNDDDCQQDESCFDFSGPVDAPDFWDDDEEAMVCLPDGWVAIFNGHVRGQSADVGGANSDDATFGLTESASTRSDSKGQGEDVLTPTASSDSEASDSDDKNADDSDGDSEDDSAKNSDGGGGCSVATGGTGSIVPALMLLGFAISRRRFRRFRRVR